VKDVAAGDSELALHIERCEHLAVLDQGPEARRVFLDQRDHPVAEGLAQSIPRSLAQRVGRVLQEDAHDVFSGRGEGRVVHGRNGQFQKRARRGAAILGIVPGSFHVVDVGTNVHGGAVLRAGRAGAGGELGQAAEGEVDLATGSLDAEVADGVEEIGRQIGRVK
jgi:hypothetical protein